MSELSLRIDWRQDYKGGTRYVAYLGEVQIGAIIVDSPESCRWAFWLPTIGSSASSQWTSVKHKTDDVARAKLAVVGKLDEWLRKAKLGPYEEAMDGLGLRGA